MSSGAATPEQAILEELSRPLGQWTPYSPPGAGGWQAGTYRGGRAELVDMESVRFVKRRETRTRVAIWVTWLGVNPRFGDEPQEYRYLYEVTRDPSGGWCTHGSSGGAGREPAWEQPTVNLGAGGWPDRFSAGGTVVGAAQVIAQVQLRFANGVVLSDEVQEGVVVFITDEHVETPATAVLLDGDGVEVRSHEALPDV